MKKIVLFFVTMFVLTSCTKNFYQVYDVEAEHLKKTSNALIYSNDDCCIYYNLWSDSGYLGFIFENTSNRDLFLDLSRSFFINNGVAFDYYEAGSQSATISITDKVGEQVKVQGVFREGVYLPNLWNPGYARMSYSIGLQHAVSATHSVTKIAPKYVCIPPKSSKIIQGFNISTYLYKDSSNKRFNFPRKESKLIYYDVNNTPLTFRNRLVYFFTPNDVDNFVAVDNEFWIKSVQNFSEKNFIEIKYSPTGYNNQKSTPRVKQKASNKFYNKYYKTIF